MEVNRVNQNFAGEKESLYKPKVTTLRKSLKILKRKNKIAQWLTRIRREQKQRDGFRFGIYIYTHTWIYTDI